jgi:predicted DNA-binding transcriptional regulator AlpA
MEWNRNKAANLAANNAATVYDEPDPAYTLNLKQVVTLTGLYAMKIHRFQRDGQFPMPKKFGPNDVKYHPQDITDYLRDVAMGREWSPRK